MRLFCGLSLNILLRFSQRTNFTAVFNFCQTNFLHPVVIKSQGLKAWICFQKNFHFSPLNQKHCFFPPALFQRIGQGFECLMSAPISTTLWSSLKVRLLRPKFPWQDSPLPSSIMYCLVMILRSISTTRKNPR